MFVLLCVLSLNRINVVECWWKKTFVCCHQLSWQDDEKKKKKRRNILFSYILSKWQNILQSLKVTMKENLKLNCSKDRQIVLT